MGDSFVNYFQTLFLDPSMIVTDIIVILGCMIVFSEWKLEWKCILKRVGWFIADYALIVLLNALFFSVIIAFFAGNDYIAPPIGFYAADILVLVFVVFTQSRKGLKRKAVLAIIVCAFMLSMLECSGYVAAFFTDWDLWQDYLEMVVRWVITALVVVFAFFFRRYHVQDSTKHTTSWVMYVSVIMYAVILLVLVFVVNLLKNARMFPDDIVNDFLFGLFLVLSAANVLLYYLLYRDSLTRSQMVQLQEKNFFLEKMSESIRINQANLDEIRKVRHDIKNQFAVMNAMLADKKYDELETYFHRIMERNLYVVSTFDCGNQAVNMAINLEQAKANSLGLDLDCTAVVDKTLPIQDEDICGLLTNLIDNALESCEREEIRPALIKAALKQEGDYLYIAITNPVKAEDAETVTSEELVTSKEDKKHHGYGHIIVEEIVARYNGCINRSISAHQFIVDIMLKIA